MKKLILLSLAILHPSITSAQILGCYEDVRYPGMCFEGEISCALNNNIADEQALHGTATGGLCFKYSVALGETQACTDAYTAMITNRDEWVTYSSSQAKLIKKLKKACGAKCKKIK